IVGGVAGGFVGVAGGVSIGVANTSVQAFLGAGATVNAMADVDVNALSRKNVQLYALSVGGRFVGIRSEEHTSELQSLMRLPYAVFCLKQKKHSQKQHIQ